MSPARRSGRLRRPRVALCLRTPIGHEIPRTAASLASVYLRHRSRLVGDPSSARGGTRTCQKQTSKQEAGMTRNGCLENRSASQSSFSLARRSPRSQQQRRLPRRAPSSSARSRKKWARPRSRRLALPERSSASRSRVSTRISSRRLRVRSRAWTRCWGRRPAPGGGGATGALSAARTDQRAVSPARRRRSAELGLGPEMVSKAVPILTSSSRNRAARTSGTCSRAR